MIVDESQPHSSILPVSKADALKVAEIIEDEVKAEEDSDEEERGRLIKEEAEEAETKVTWDTAKSAFKYLGGWRVLIIGFILNSFVAALRIAKKFVDRFWATGSMEIGGADQEEAKNHIIWNLKLSLAVFILEMILDKLRENMNRSIAEETTDKFFALLFDKIIHAPIPTYFDVTPTSRIMRHFHHDLRAFDMHVLYMIFEMFIQI
jgi:ABC-type multidrug transport system fused ATPase/permease subunit